ncbi:hypothetical protein CVT24_002684 [Panaeolus cyanescens]|uniref:AIG1-type G domain-containing protein n=1 Tax=Panaeolus cyanescens TaxID=181874 RepID=A0A409WBC6_9AGAR|nr:hypothetical protein CVT24_002684 [Panaeolus cyanescens]
MRDSASIKHPWYTFQWIREPIRLETTTPESGLVTHLQQRSDPPRALVEVETLKSTAVNSDDKIILLLGPTGAGKSNFIEKLTTEKLGISSSGLDRGTSEVQAYRVLGHPVYKNKIVIVDTPGFQDRSMSEYGSLKAIKNWIISSKATRLHALFYFDRIRDNTRGQDPQCQKIFGFLSGDAYGRAYLVTTTWDMIEDMPRLRDSANSKLDKFKETFGDNRILKFYNTAASAGDVLAASLRRDPVEFLVRFSLESSSLASFRGPPMGEILLGLLKEKYSLALNMPALPSEIATLRGELLEFPDGNAIVEFVRALSGWDEDPDLENLSQGTELPYCVVMDIAGTASHLVIVDTPGLEDLRFTFGVGGLISTWMKHSNEFIGIVYLHRITDIRFDSNAAKGLKSLRHICEGDRVDKVCFTTTKWNDISTRMKPQYEQKEARLKKEQWSTFLARNSKTSRFDTTTDESARQTALATLQTIMDGAKRRKSVTAIR